MHITIEDKPLVIIARERAFFLLNSVKLVALASDSVKRMHHLLHVKETSDIIFVLHSLHDASFNPFRLPNVFACVLRLMA